MIHWSNQISRLKKELSTKSLDGGFVFRNGDRLKLPEEPNTSRSAFYRQFVNPCYRIPAMVITDSGRIIIASDYRSKPDDQVAIVPCIAYSDDNGATWKKKIIYLPESSSFFNPYCRIMDSTMWIDKQGHINIISGMWNGTGNNNNWTQTQNDGTWKVLRHKSADNGETWTTQWGFQRNVQGLQAGASWLGGVGNCVITKQGTIIVPIQWSPSPGKVNMSFIYSNDGENWTKFPGNAENCSETSVSSWVNTSGKTELLFISRRDPNNPKNKYAGYVVQNQSGGFDSNNFTTYQIYDGKVPARGNSGCMGSQIAPSGPDGNYTPFNNVMVSYPKNFFDGINAYNRDHIVVAGFPYTDSGDTNSRKLKEFEMINVKPGGWRENTPFGGYSILAYNHKARKMGIAYEDMLGIGYKDLSYLIPQFLNEPAKE